MTISIAHLGPTGTYTETAALGYASWLTQTKAVESILCPCPSIAQTLRSVAQEEADLAVVPIENSIHGSIATTLDSVWELNLQIHKALVLPIAHTLLCIGGSLENIQTVYSHPQALGQCQKWLEKCLPAAELVPTNSTTEALQYLESNPTAAAIASERASQLYNLPIVADHLNDYPDNCTRFWVLGREASFSSGTHISLAFTVAANVPGALVKPLQVFASRGINLSRIESRPTKRSLGEYLFFIDLEVSTVACTQAALAELSTHTEVLKIFGNYNILPIE